MYWRTPARSDAVEVLQGLLAVRSIVVGLVDGLSVVEIGEGQAIGESLAAGDGAGEVVVEHVEALAGKVAILRSIMGRRGLHVVAAVHEEIELAVADGQP